MKVTYELDVHTSSLEVFSSLWGFHRIGLLTYPPECTKVLYVSDNLVAHTTSANDRQNFSMNQGIVEGLFFLMVTANHKYSFIFVCPSTWNLSFEPGLLETWCL